MVQVMNIMFKRTESVPAEKIAAITGRVIINKDPEMRKLSEHLFAHILPVNELHVSWKKIQYFHKG